MNSDLSGKKALISGASKGIGKAVARKLVQAGADVGICARNNDTLKLTADELKTFGTRVEYASVDVSDADALATWVKQTADHLGGIDMLVPNPSAFGIGASREDWQSGYAVDLMGTVNMVQAAMPWLEISAQTGDAGVVLVASALVAETDEDSAYGAIKSALVHYNKGLARKLATKNIRVNAVSPGTIFIEGGFWDQMKSNMPQVYEAFLNRNPTGRMGTAEEVANAVVFLLSTQSSFISGVNLLVDGAFTHRVNF